MALLWGWVFLFFFFFLWFFVCLVFFFFFFFFLLFRASRVAYGSSLDRVKSELQVPAYPAATAMFLLLGKLCFPFQSLFLRMKLLSITASGGLVS